MKFEDQIQQVFCLSMLSGFPNNITGPECQIAEKSTTDVSNLLNDPKAIDLIGEWEMVWGFGIFQFQEGNKNLADNAMYVAKSKTGPTRYAICVAGTNGASLYAWFVEDFYVSETQTWPYATSPGLSLEIACGTAIGLGHLQDMHPCPGLPGAGLTLQEFLTQTIANEPSGETIEVITTGHSLGGALSPTLALWLENIKPDWDPDNKTIVTTYPSAGPTAGIQDFATYSDNTLGDRCIRIWNNLDIVPHAWNVDQLKEIPGLYRPEIPPTALVYGLAQLAIKNTNGHPYTQLNDNGGCLAGEVVQLPNPSPDEFTQFITQALYQHVVAYFPLLGVEEFWEIMAQYMGIESTIENYDAIQPSAEEIAELKAKIEKFLKTQQA